MLGESFAFATGNESLDYGLKIRELGILRMGIRSMLGKMHDSLPGHGSPGSWKQKQLGSRNHCLTLRHTIYLSSYPFPGL